MTTFDPFLKMAIRLMLSNEESSGDKLLKLLVDRVRERYGPITAQRIVDAANKNKSKEHKPSQPSTAIQQLKGIITSRASVATQTIVDIANRNKSNEREPSHPSTASQQLESSITNRVSAATPTIVDSANRNKSKDGISPCPSTARGEELSDSDEEHLHDFSTACATSSSERQALLMCDRDMQVLDQDNADQNNSLACNVTPESFVHQLNPKTGPSGLVNSKNITQETLDGKNICSICMQTDTTSMNTGMTCKRCHSYNHQKCISVPITVDGTVCGFGWYCQSCLRRPMLENNPFSVLPKTNGASTSYAE